MQEYILKNGETLVVQKAAPEDAAAVLAFLNRAGGESDNMLFGENAFTLTVQQEADYLRAQAQSETSVTLCGKVGGQVVCVASLQTPSQPRIAHTSSLAIVVAKSFWGQGVGSAVIARLFAFARTAGITLVHLGVRADNSAARALYRKMGFEETGVYKNYFQLNGKYCDEILMAQQLNG
ncbi:MAG: GNAT family N-acetyltransferase [Oscillospiraceae bacterium]